MDGPASATLYTLGACLVVRLPEVVGADTLRRTTIDVLDRLRAGTSALIVLDLEAVTVLDRWDLDEVGDLVQAVALMGRPTAMTGVGPGIAAVMAERPERVTGLRFLPDLEAAAAYAGRLA